MGAGVRRNLILLVCLAATVATFLDGLSLAVDTTVHVRHSFYSIPAAISFLSHGGGGYTAYADLAELFVENHPDITNKLIARAVGLTSLDKSQLLFIPADDKGSIDFVVASFLVFGARLESLYYGFFALLGLSAGLYAWQFRRNDMALVTLAVILLSLYATTGVLPITKELHSFHNPRVLGTLAIIPFVHLSYLMLLRVPFSVPAILSAVVQAALVVEAVHIRSTEAWAVLALLPVAALLVLRRPRSPRHLWPAAIVAVCLIALFSYQRAAYHPDYFSTKGQGRVFWHNVGIGFSLHPALAEKYDLAVDDLSMVNLVHRHAAAVGGPELVQTIFGAAEPGYKGVADDLVLYERMARDVVIGIVRDHPLDTLTLFLWIKPKLLLKNLLWAAGLYPDNYDALHIAGQIGSIAAPEARVHQQIYYSPMTWATLLGLAALTLLAPTAAFAPAAIVLVIGLAVSLLPGFVTYPLIHTLAIPLVLISALFHVFALMGARRVLTILQRAPTRA